MERRRRRGHGSGLVTAAGCALVGFWMVSGGPGAGAAEEPLPRVSIAAVSDGGFAQDSPGCGASSRSLSRGELELRRTGSTATELPIAYDVQSADTGDFDPLSGTATFPAGADTTSILVSPRWPERPGPVHEHRAAILTIAVVPGAGYEVAGEGDATISLRFDVDIEPCVVPTGTPPVPGGSVDPEVAPGTNTGTNAQTAAATTNAPTPAAPATLPFTGTPFTASLAGIGSCLIALGGLGLRYAHPPRPRRRRARV